MARLALRAEAALRAKAARTRSLAVSPSAIPGRPPRLAAAAPGLHACGFSRSSPNGVAA